jgi:hypothetical protein
MLCIYNGDAVFDWDENNLRKIRAHRIRRADVEQALSNGPILVYEQNVGEESRFVYYGETCGTAACGGFDRTWRTNPRRDRLQIGCRAEAGLFCAASSRGVDDEEDH